MPTKKLIEVALPLEKINIAAAREKSIRHGHPSTLHLWWARRPLAACRAVLFASIVDDPSSHPEDFPTEELQEKERRRLFDIIERMVPWENSNDPHVLREVREEILKATNGNPPAVLDPFCGGGSIPLEAQRLGLEAHGSDLNPVAVLITKALIEIPPRFAGRRPVNPDEQTAAKTHDWTGAKGLAADVRYYGNWMREEAQKRIGHLYPKAKLPNGEEATVIAWLWARTVPCSNPACGALMPLVRSFALSTKPKKAAWVEAKVVRNDGEAPKVEFEVATGASVPAEKLGGTVNRQGATCLCCGTNVGLPHVRSEGKAGRMSAQLMAIVAEGTRERIYLAPTVEHEAVAREAKPKWKPNAALPNNPRNFNTPIYGLDTFDKLFTTRQLTALTTFSDLVGGAKKKMGEDYLTTSNKHITPPPPDTLKLQIDLNRSLCDGGSGTQAYAEAVATYIGFSVDKCADYWSQLCSWHNSGEKIRNTFSRQAIPMVWDYAEVNPFCESSGNWMAMVDWCWKCVAHLPMGKIGQVRQQDATKFTANAPLISTDPPYYDNIGYADLSDFFYIWLRHSLGEIFPDLCNTLQTPKTPELVATPYRFEGSKAKAEAFFEAGLGDAFKQMRENVHPDYPLTVYYAFKQSESEDEATGQVSTGWETMLEGLLRAGFQITGTWPMRSELSNRMIARDANALASSIVLVCRPRLDDAKSITRTQFLRELRRELPEALRTMQHGNLAPVDFAQSAIGPGMGVFSRYQAVTELDGKPLSIRVALSIINQTLDEVLSEQEGTSDPETRWAIAWFTQQSWNEGLYGLAETLSTAKGTAISGLVEAGIAISRAGKVRLVSRDELPADWSPASDKRLTVWETTQHLIRALDKSGELGAAQLLGQLCAQNSEVADRARDLAYRLYSLCERRKWASEALAYNSLVIAWPSIQELSQAPTAPSQTLLDL